MGSICWIDNHRATIILFSVDISIWKQGVLLSWSDFQNIVQLWVMKLKKQSVFLAKIVQSISFDVDIFRVEQARLARVADQIVGLPYLGRASHKMKDANT